MALEPSLSGSLCSFRKMSDVKTVFPLPLFQSDSWTFFFFLLEHIESQTAQHFETRRINIFHTENK